MHEAISDRRPGATDDGLGQVVGEADTDHRHGEEDDHAAGPGAHHLDHGDDGRDDQHAHGAPEVGEASEHVGAAGRRVVRGPAGNVEIRARDERLLSYLEREGGDGQEQREGDRQGQARDARRTEALAHEGGDAPVRGELLLHGAGRGVHGTVGRGLGIAVHRREHHGGDDAGEHAGEQEHNKYRHWSPWGGRAPRFFPRGRAGNRVRLIRKQWFEEGMA